MDLATKQLVNFTNTPNEWDEHAELSPNGKYIVWMKGHSTSDPQKTVNALTDFWIMNADGTNWRQLTHFNDPGYPEYISTGGTAADNSWNPSGTALAAYVVTSQSKKTGFIDLLQLSFASQ